MTEKAGDLLVISKEKPQQCDFCGEIRELRPYGPNGETICFPCAMKDEETTKKMFAKRLLGNEVESDI